MINRTSIGATSTGPFNPATRSNPGWAGLVPFVLPQNLFKGGLTQQKIGQGILAQVAAASASTNYVITHNLGHPINCAWVVATSLGVFSPAIAITSNTTKAVTVQFSAVAIPVVVALF